MRISFVSVSMRSDSSVTPVWMRGMAAQIGAVAHEPAKFTVIGEIEPAPSVMMNAESLPATEEPVHEFTQDGALPPEGATTIARATVAPPMRAAIVATAISAFFM